MTKKINTQVIGFIPARSGSTRLKNKNIKMFCSKPLVYWTVEKALKCKQIDKVIFSSDSKLYYKLILSFFKKKINFTKLSFDFRGKKYSTKKYKIFNYIQNLFKKRDNTLIVNLLPTAPLRSNKSIIQAINYAKTNGVNVFSCSKYFDNPFFVFKLKKKKPIALFKKNSFIIGNTQSHNKEKYYYPTGLIQCLWANKLDKNEKCI